MTQHDYVIDNATGSVVRADINSALQAVITTNGGNSAPSTTAAGQLWWDSDANTLYIRNTADSAWLAIAGAAVGIGIAAPTYLLHLVANQPDLKLQWAANYSGRILFSESTTLTGAITMHSPSDTVNDVLTGNQQDGNMVLGTGASGAAGEALVLVTNGVEHMRIAADGTITSALQPSFHTYLSSTMGNCTGNDVAVTIQFGDDSTDPAFDRGGDYNNGTYTFTAPVDGIYLLTATAAFGDLTSTNTDGSLDLVVTSGTKGYRFNPGSIEANAAYGVATVINTTQIYMDANDTCTVLATIKQGTQIVDIQGGAGATHFSGCLLA
jgi:hypothetical protein